MKRRAGERRLPIGLAQAVPFAFCDYLFSLVAKSKGAATPPTRISQSVQHLLALCFIYGVSDCSFPTVCPNLFQINKLAHHDNVQVIGLYF